MKLKRKIQHEVIKIKCSKRPRQKMLKLTKKKQIHLNYLNYACQSLGHSIGD